MSTQAEEYVRQSKYTEFKAKIFERSMISSFEVFTRNFCEQGQIDEVEFEILKQQFSLLNTIIEPPTAIVYLRCSPEKAFERMNQRGSLESGLVQIDYLQALHDLHERWLFGDENLVPIHIIDANQDQVGMRYSFQGILNLLLKPGTDAKINFSSRIKKTFIYRW